MDYIPKVPTRVLCELVSLLRVDGVDVLECMPEGETWILERTRLRDSFWVEWQRLVRDIWAAQCQHPRESLNRFSDFAQ